MCGSMGCAFSTITNNHIYNIWRKRQFTGAEMGAIKFHAPIDVLIENNCIHDAFRGLWMDWMSQGTRITSNVCYNNDFADFHLELNHGPFLVDNNILMSGIQSWSQGGAYVHNIIGGMILLRPVLDRFTPYFFPHSTELMGVSHIKCGDDRFYNNIFIETDFAISYANVKTLGYGLEAYNMLEGRFPVFAGNNIYYNGAIQLKNEEDSYSIPTFNPEVKIVEENGQVFLEYIIDSSLEKVVTDIVTTASLGITVMVKTQYENRDGTALIMDTDYFGRKRDGDNPAPGPFENTGPGKRRVKVWPVN